MSWNRRLMMGMAVGGDSLPDYSAYRGVYIEDVDGYLYTRTEWGSVNKTANGIAVLTDNCRFVISLQNANASYCQWGSSGTIVNGVTTTTTRSQAMIDYDGEQQTDAILSELGNSSNASDAPAAYYCRAFTFPNGNKGYLGAAGEWQAAISNKDEIINALSLVLFMGDVVGDNMDKAYYWTSTQYNANSSWYAYWSDKYLAGGNKTSNIFVRAFTSLKSDDKEQE